MSNVSTNCFSDFIAQLLLGVRCVARLRRSQPIALDGHGEDHRRSALVLERPLVGVVDLCGIVAAAMQPDQLVVGIVFHQLQQLWILAEEMLAQIRSTLGLVCLEVAIHGLFHALQQQPLVVAREQLIPIRTPDDLDDIPSRAEERALQARR